MSITKLIIPVAFFCAPFLIGALSVTFDSLGNIQHLNPQLSLEECNATTYGKVALYETGDRGGFCACEKIGLGLYAWQKMGSQLLFACP